MSDAFVQPTPEEIHHTLLQFMGQNMGEFKKLDETLVSRTNSLQGMTLQPRQVLNTIPVPPQPTQQPQPQFQPQPQHQQPAYIAPVQVDIHPQQHTIEVRDPNDPVQLEFNFNNNPLSKSIFNILREIQETQETHTLLLNKIAEQLDKKNKKKEAVS